MVRRSRKRLGVLYAPIGDVWLEANGKVSFDVAPDVRQQIVGEELEVLERLEDDLHKRVPVLDAHGGTHVIGTEPDSAALAAVNDELQRRSDGYFVMQSDWAYISERATDDETRAPRLE